MCKLIVITAPSGAGKTTIVRHLLDCFDNLAFSVSATTRQQRAHEVDGRDYYFLSFQEFETLIRQGEFIEWEEVYPGQYYGTLKREVERIWAEGRHIIFDIDVQGAMNIKDIYGSRAITIYVKPPSIEVLSLRLQQRKTESAESLQKRLERAVKEVEFENNFDYVLVNDTLEKALQEAEQIVGSCINH